MQPDLFWSIILGVCLIALAVIAIPHDLGVLKEAPEESTEVALRRQLLEKSKENDKVWCS